MALGKHVALAIELEKDILAGKYGWEGGLPSTSELAQRWNMSINTVKNSLSLLEGKNLIEKRGIGYYVNRIPTVMTQYVPPHSRYQMEQPLENRIPTVMTQYVPPAHIRLHREGYCKNLGPVKRVSLPEHLAEKLHFPQSEPVIYRVQISGEIAEGSERPLQVSYRYHFLPMSEEKVQRMQNDATYDPMWDETHAPADLVSHDEVTPRLATEGERDLLSLPESTPITSVFEAIRDKSDDLLMAQEIVLSPRTTLIFDFPFTNRP